MSPFGIAVALGFAEADAVDDRGVIERVGDDGVLFAEQRFEQSAVGVETRGVEDGVFGPEKRARSRARASLCTVLRAADEAHRRQSESIAVERALGGFDQSRVSREPEVVVGAEILEVGASGLLARSNVERPGAWSECALLW